MVMRKKKRKNIKRKRSKYPMAKGVLIGLLSGLLIVVGVTFYITNILLPNPTSQTADPANASVDSQKKPRLSFYDSLLENKDIESYASGSVNRSQAQKSYFLQVAAFRSSREADNLKAKLALAGFESRIIRSELEKDDIWYRVRLGPFENETKLWSVKTALGQHDFQANVVTVPN